MEETNRASGGMLKALGKAGSGRILICALIGIALILAGNFWFGEGKKSSAADQNRTVSDSNAASAAELRQYTEALETEIAELCSGVSGVGTVRAAVTLSGGFRYVYAQNSQTTAGGAVHESYVTVGSGSSEGTVYLSVLPPQIAGIGIVCAGGDNQNVRRELIALLSAAYGIGSNKIYVTGGGN